MPEHFRKIGGSPAIGFPQSPRFPGKKRVRKEREPTSPRKKGRVDVNGSLSKNFLAIENSYVHLNE